MVATRRAEQREATAAEIKRVARRQMAERGAAALSLRAIAAEMGLTAPALYRYFPARDDLVTALIVDAYGALGDAIDAAQTAAPALDHRARFFAAARAYRRWAIDHRSEFDLIFGTPIPGYDAPPAVTVPVVRRAFHPLLAIPADAWSRGRLHPPEPHPADGTDERLRRYLITEEIAMPAPVLRVLLEGWSLMHGMITLEVLGHLPPILGDVAEMYETAIGSWIDRFGLHPDD